LSLKAKTYAKGEAQKFYTDTITRANSQRDEKLRANQQAALFDDKEVMIITSPNGTIEKLSFMVK